MILKALIFGAGSVGRGFIAQLFHHAGMEVVFADVLPGIIEAINREHAYPHYTVRTGSVTEEILNHVSAIRSDNAEAVDRAVLEADILATAVGARVLAILAPSLARALKKRMDAGRPPLNILLCENLHGVAKIMRTYLLQAMPEMNAAAFDANVGLLATSIERMIPVASEEMLRKHPAAIRVEPYPFLPYDSNAVRGRMPEIPNLIPSGSIRFEFYADRKLYVHNMGHCSCAYLAAYYGDEYIWQTVARPEVRYVLRAAMMESSMALAKAYDADLQVLLARVDDLLYRFSNRGLADTAERVGRDPKRKLAAGDRFLGSYELCLRQGIPARYTSLALALGLLRLEKEAPLDAEGGIEAYLRSQNAKVLELPEAWELLQEQIASLRKGFCFEEQLALAERIYEQPDRRRA